MEVLKENFRDILPVFQEALERAEIVGLDLEFTGIKGRPEYYNDTLQERYEKNRRVAMTYKIIQVGVCLMEKKNNKWEARPFNFYVFPEEIGSNNPRVILEAGAIAFLRMHDMDFNKWIYQGIPYMNSQQDQEMFNKLYTREKEEESELNISKPYDVAKIESAIKTIEEFLTSEQKQTELTGLNAFLRKYMYSHIKKNYPQLFVETLREQKGKVVTILLKKVGESELAALEEQKTKEKEKHYYEKLGFRRVFTMLAESKKTIVCHNGIYDLMFMLASFHGELPESYCKFKEIVRTLFPNIVDTRYLLEKVPGLWDEFNHASAARGLGEFYSFLLPKYRDLVFLSAGFERYKDENYAHEAAYDALMCATCLVILQENFPVEPYLNFLPVYRSFFCINLSGEDLLDSEEHVHFKGEEVRSFFAGKEGFNAKFIKEDEAFVQATSPEHSEELRSLMQGGKFTVMSLEDYFKSKNTS